MIDKWKMKLKDELVSNIIWSFLAKVFAMVFYFIADVFYARYLGVDAYAEWVFFFSIANMAFRISCLGINISSKVHVAKSTKREHCFGAAICLRTVVSSIIFLIILIIAPALSDKIGYPSPYPNLKLLMGIMGMMAFLYSFTEFFKQLYIGIQELKKLCIITFLEYFSYCFFTICFLFIKANPTSIALGYCVAGILILLYNILEIPKKYNKELIFEGIRNLQIQKKIFKYAIPLALTTLGSLILLEMDTFMLGLFGTKQQVSVYSIAKQLVSKATNVNMAIWTGTVASLTLITKENFEEKRNKFKKVNQLNNIAALIICVCFILFGKIAIEIVYGNEYASAGNILLLLLPYYFLYCLSSLYANFLDFIGHAKTRALWYTSVIVINLALNYLLIPSYGAVGAAIATNASIVPYTTYCVYDVWYIFKYKKLN